jgi:hypothetical protein
MSDPYRHDEANREMMSRSYRSESSGMGPLLGGIAVIALIVMGALFYFSGDRADNVATKSPTSTTGTAPMNPPPGNPGTGSGAPQGSANTPSTTGSAPAR